MKVPYIESPFKVISIHHCTVFGVGDVQNQEEGVKMHSFASVHLSVCVY